MVGRKSDGFFSQTGIQFLFSLRRASLRFGPTFFMSCIKLCERKSICCRRPSILLFETRRADSLIVQPIGFFVAFSRIGLLHHVVGLLGVVTLLTLELLDLLVERLQLLRLLVVAFVAVAAHAAALTEQVFAVD